MHKTTVYLPDDLKLSLRRLAQLSGRSEADLIRAAIASQVQAAGRPRPRGRLFQSGDPALADQVDEALAGFGTR